MVPQWKKLVIVVQPHLEALEDISFHVGFVKRTYVAPPKIHFEQVKVIDHPTHFAQAIIARRPEGFYQVAYRVLAPAGGYLPAIAPEADVDWKWGWEWEWGITHPTDPDGKDLKTFADSVESAEAIALLELNAVVEADPQIKTRPT